MSSDPTDPELDPDVTEIIEPSTRTGDAKRLAAANEAAVFGDGEAGKATVPGIISGDLGVKGKVSAQLRDLSRHERSVYGEVPKGTHIPGTGRYVLLPMIAIALLLVAVVFLLGWLAG